MFENYIARENIFHNNFVAKIVFNSISLHGGKYILVKLFTLSIHENANKSIDVNDV